LSFHVVFLRVAYCGACKCQQPWHLTWFYRKTTLNAKAVGTYRHHFYHISK